MSDCPIHGNDRLTLDSPFHCTCDHDAIVRAAEQRLQDAAIAKYAARHDYSRFVLACVAFKHAGDDYARAVIAMDDPRALAAGR